MTTTVVAPTQAHDENFGGPLGFDDASSDCAICHTGATRVCECGGRVHNEMHTRLVEMCFSCGEDWSQHPLLRLGRPMAGKIDHEKQNRLDKARKPNSEPPPWPDDEDAGARKTGGTQASGPIEALRTKYDVLVDAYARLHSFEQVAQHDSYRSALARGTRREQNQLPSSSEFVRRFSYEKTLALHRLDALYEEANTRTSEGSGEYAGRKAECFGQKATIVDHDDEVALVVYDNGVESAVPYEAVRLL